MRLHPEDQDPERLLDPDEQVSEPWGENEGGRCDKCDGSGRTVHRCQSCAEEADPGCENCGGEVRYEDDCPACKGSGRLDPGEKRDGVSVFPDADGLYRYMVRRDADLAGSLIVRLEGEPTGEDDFDADEGAVLVRPTRIVCSEQVDWDRVEEIRAELA